MATRNMRIEGEDDILRKKSRPVERFDKRLWDLLDDMAETMNQHNGVGLAAVQVGILRRAFIVDVGDGIIEFINPTILKEDGKQCGPEGCLSSPGVWALVSRPDYVKIRAQDRNGNWFEEEGTELFARAVCHEYDHLDGIVFKDHAEKYMSADEVDDWYAQEEKRIQKEQAGKK